jgi:hypothetical protein
MKCPYRHGGEVQVNILPICNLALEGNELWAPLIYPKKETWYPLYRRPGGPRGQSGQVRNIPPPMGLDPWTIQVVASRYAD